MFSSDETKGAEVAGARTQSANVYGALYRDIVRGVLRPMARLRLDELKRSYDVGLSPLREALMKLSSDGLLVLEEHKGFRVAAVSRRQLLDITSTRKDLESIAIRRSIENGDDGWEAGILASMHALKRRNKLGPDNLVDDEWERRHKAFHDSLVAASGSEWLQKFREQLYDQADRYRRLSVHYLSAPRDDVAEHQEIADSVLSRDVDGSIYLIKKHFDRTVSILLSGPQVFDN